MEDVAVTAGSLVTLIVTVGAYTAVAWATGRRLGLRLRSEEALALGAVMVCVLCATGYLASRILTAVWFRLDGGVVSVPLTLLAGVLAAVPALTAVAIVLTRRRSAIAWARWPDGAALRALARWALPAVVITALAVAATVHYGTANTFRTDSGWRSDAVKELVWANSANVGRSPSLSSENQKYTGYLVTRATLTAVTGDPPWRPNLAWVALCVAALAAAVFALVRNLGLGVVPASAAVVVVPLLGGDAYRFGNVSDARGLAATVALTGFALLAAGLKRDERRPAVAALGGAVCGVAALMHVQYIVIVASMLVPCFLVALVAKRRLGDLWRGLGLATVAACAVMLLAVPQALSFGTSSVEEAALERSTSGLAALLQAEETVWPPRRVTLDVPLLYVAPHLYALHPETLTDGVWGDRTAPLLVLAGLVAALLLVRRRRGDPLLAVLIAGALAAPILVLFNPVVFPAFAKYFAPYRSEYIGFEFAFLGVAAVVALLRAQPLLGAGLAAAIVAAGLPVVDATRKGYASLERFDRLMQAPDQREWRAVETDTRHGDLLVAESPLYDATGALGRRRTYKPESIGIPSPFDPTADPEQVRKGLAEQDGRVVILYAGPVPRRSPLQRLIESGTIRPAGRPAAQGGIVHRQVDLQRAVRARAR